MQEARHAVPRNPYIPAGEPIIVSIKPGVLSIVVRPLPSLAVVGVLGLASHLIGSLVGPPGWGLRGVQAAAALVALRILYEALVWGSRRYALTDKRVLGVRGVFQRHAAEIALERVQHVVVHKTLRERVTGLGTIGFASAGSGAVDLAWVMVARPHRLADTIRQSLGTRADRSHEPGNDQDSGLRLTAISDEPPERAQHDPSQSQACGRRSRSPDHDSPTPSGGSPGPIVIGIAGGIGAGKSMVAREFARLGCLVIDSDALAREALQTPLVRARLVRWWGKRILDDRGAVDRSRVASIVFADPAQRQRLESLVHPMVKQSRGEMIARAGDRPAVIVDAPLLFEAGIDRECDAVVFVDAPRPTRLARVHRSRGWDDAELERRERAQMSLKEKRARCNAVIDNTGDPAELVPRVRDVLEQLTGSGDAGTEKRAARTSGPLSDPPQSPPPDRSE